MITPLFGLGQEIFYVWYDFSMEALFKDVPPGQFRNNLLTVTPDKVTLHELSHGKICYGFEQSRQARISENLITTDKAVAERFVERANAGTFKFRQEFTNNCNLSSP